MQCRPRRPFYRERLRYDATFAIEASYVVEHALPYSEYLERWEPSDRSIVIAVTMERAERCSMCGTAQREWDDDPFAYAPERVTCPGCRARETLQSDTSEPLGKGVSVVLMTSAQITALEAKRARYEAAGHTGPPRRRRDG